MFEAIDNSLDRDALVPGLVGLVQSLKNVDVVRIRFVLLIPI